MNLNFFDIFSSISVLKLKASTAIITQKVFLRQICHSLELNVIETYNASCLFTPDWIFLLLFNHCCQFKSENHNEQHCV